ncbi:hypothetical protein A3D11_00495 [Candidatus Peribacteria bacterium RIFCSPHIGHO2_02_FULL_49_16]|nr:MAG: hypothetical protein A3D11_00495 [Candidatus Peribacteria bacterium RIFCSPHIGHO2_02_FULL_49_16]
MMERGISTSRVAETVRHPDSHFPARGGAIGCIKRFGIKTLKVIFGIRGKVEYVIITAYYL